MSKERVVRFLVRIIIYIIKVFYPNDRVNIRGLYIKNKKNYFRC